MEASRGGRPRNAWNSTRRRKLIRLYTLTKLSLEEIINVLKAENFQPCRRDVQNTLRQLVPGYTKDFREIQPRTKDDMKVRFKRLQRCHGGRVLKRRRNEERSEQRYEERYLRQFEGPADAFRNYGDSTSSKTFRNAPSTLKDSEFVNPSSLLLDGTSVGHPNPQGIYENVIETSKPISTTSNVDTPVNIQISGSNPSYQSMSTGVNNIARLKRQLAGKQLSQSSLKHVQHVMRLGSWSNSWRSSLLSLTSVVSSWKSMISRTISGHMDEHYENGIPSQRARKVLSKQSNLCTTGTRNDRSATQSSGSSIHTDHGPGTEATKPLEIAPTSAKTSLTFVEQGIWDELIANNGLDCECNGNNGLDCHIGRSVLDRSCCSGSDLWKSTHKARMRCERCGLSPQQRRAIQLSSRLQPDNWDNGAHLYCEKGAHSDTDFFGNSILHCISASMDSHRIWVIRHIVRLLADFSGCINRRNTSGQTFLHVLCLRLRGQCWEVSDFQIFEQVLNELSVKLGVWQLDFEGRTFLDCLLPNWEWYNSQNLAETMLGKDKTYNTPSLDSHGMMSRSDVSWLAERVSVWCTRARGLRAKYSSIFQNMSDEGKASWWSTRISEFPYLHGVDNDGNTILTALLRSWKEERGSQFLEQIVKLIVDRGAEIHMKDRTGQTPLAIAALRGFRSVVVLLIEEGANIHSRDKSCSGILSSITDRMEEAKAFENDVLYARLLSCFHVLVDAGAVEHPSEELEWKTSSSQADPSEASEDESSTSGMVENELADFDIWTNFNYNVW